MARVGQFVKKDSNNPGKVIGIGRFVPKDPNDVQFQIELFKKRLREKMRDRNTPHSRKTKFV